MRDLTQARDMLEVFVRAWREDGICYWAVTAEDDDEPIGFAGLRLKVVNGTEHFNLYYRLAPHYWGRGIGREIAGRAVALAHERWPDRPVIARMRDSNIPAQRVAKAVGLKRAGFDSRGRILFADRPLYPSFLEQLP